MKTGIIIKSHALAQMARRGIDEAEVRAVVEHPEAMIPVREGRMVAQAMVRGLLLRVFVDVDREPWEVVTVYATSKVEKYRSKP